MVEDFQGTQRYTVRREIGSGGMGSVYEAYDSVRGIPVALKVMRGYGSEELIAFKREFRTIAERHHPNLVRLFELEDNGEALFYTMELVSGGSLRHLIGPESDGSDSSMTTSRPSVPVPTGVTEQPEPTSPRTEPLPLDDDEDDTEEEPKPSVPTPSGTAILPMDDDDEEYEQAVDNARQTVAPQLELQARPATPVADIMRVLPQILDALEYLHAHNIVHCDLKPDNILLDDTGKVRLVDFGITKEIRDDRHTAWVGGAIGTMEYMAPEQAVRGMITAATDLYALGIILYEMCVGTVPFTGSPYDVMAHHRHKVPNRVSQLVSGLPLALVDVIEALLAKEAAERPTIAEIRAELDLERVIPHSLVASGGNRFVGREKERLVLAEQLDRVEDGEMQLALISGESGLGKTALANAAVARAKDRGFRIFRGRCYEREELPYRAFDRIMDDVALYLRKRSQKTKAEVNPDLRPLSWLFGSFRMLRRVSLSTWQPWERGDAEPSPNRMDPRERRAQAFLALRPLIEALSQSRPVLFVIDDLQWTDIESLELLVALMNNAADQSLMVVGSFRPEDVAAGHPLSDFLEAHGEHEALRHVELEPLMDHEVRKITEHILGRALPAEMLPAIVEQSGGNPFFVEEIARYIAKEGVTAQSVEEVPALAELVEGRFAALSDEARKLASLAAVAGGASVMRFLRNASGLVATDFNPAFNELVDSKILRPASEQDALGASRAPPSRSGGPGPTGPPTPSGSITPSDPSFDFYHDKIRTVAYEALAEEQQRGLHETIAETLEDMKGVRADSLLRHWRASGNRLKTIEYGLIAAEEAAQYLAFGRAASLYRGTIELRDEQPESTAEFARETARLYDRLAESLEYTGDYSGATTELSNALDVLPKTAEDEETRRGLQIHLADDLVKLGRVERGTDLFEAVLRPFGLKLQRGFWGALAQVVWLKIRTVFSPMFRFGRRRVPSVHDRTSLDLYKRIYESFGLVKPLYMAEYQARFQLLAGQIEHPPAQIYDIAMNAIFRAMTGGSDEDLAHAHKMLDEAASLAEGEDDISWIIYTQGSRGFIDCVAGRWGPARAELEEAVEDYREVGADRRWEVNLCKFWLMLTYYYEGDVEGLASIAEELTSGGRADVVRFSMGAWGLVCDHARSGRVDEAARLLTEWEDTLPEGPMTHFRANLAIAANAVDNARAEHTSVFHRMSRLEDDVRDAGCLLGKWDVAHWYLPGVEAAVGLARAEKLESPQAKLARKWAKNVVKAAPPFFACVAERGLALIELHQGNQDEAKKLVSKALLTSETANVPHHRWLCLSAASEIGVSSPEQDDEMKSLSEKYGYA